MEIILVVIFFFILYLVLKKYFFKPTKVLESVVSKQKKNHSNQCPALNKLPSYNFEDVARELGWFNLPLSSLFSDSWQNGKNPRQAGRLLNKEEKRSHGIRANSKIGEDYINSLTPDGVNNIMIASEVLFYRSTFRKSRLENLKQLIDMAETVNISSCDDGADCNKVKQLKKREYKLDSLPVLPLEGCDAEYCRCSYSLGKFVDASLNDLLN